ncbi:hypothetical protein [Bordetella sp. H567]|uniref:hypothetical protein n=1 Tax=Bordetella sp. H567 TaxID=1697043 RepID=UPI0011AB54D7|nr:hypothetical protein [Bordetella sp. H567]
MRTKRAPAEVPVSPPPVRQQAAVIARAEQHPDVEAALHALRDAVTQAAPRTPEASRKTTRYTGARPLQNIARAQRHSKDVLHQRAMGFYKAAIALSRDPNGAASQKNAAIMLAALAQRAEAEGYEAVEKDLVKRVMTPLLHSLSLEALCQLARLNDRDDGLGDQILHDAGKLLGTDKPPQTADGAQARRQSNVASALLGLLAELSREHARAASWDGQVAAALEAARNGQHQRLDAALREMWQGDLLAGDIGTPRSQRLKELVERLAPDQQDALARMLGTDGAVDAATINFNDFTLRHLGEFETDPTMHRQMLGFIEHLRAASRATLHAGTNAFAPAGQPVPQSGADASVFPARITPPATLGSTFRRLRQSVASTFRRKATTRDAAKTEINKAVLQLIAGGRLDATHVQALQSVNDKLADKLGRSKGTTFQGVLVQEALSRLSPDQLGQLRASLTAARNDPHVSTGQDTGVKAFYRMLETRLDREAHIRRGAAALNEVLAALQQPRHPEKLVTALDLLADVHVQAPPQQSELDYYADALGRLGDTARATLQKRLKGREDIQRHMRGIRDELIHEPAAWLQYRHGQLNTLSVAARTKV